MQKQKFDPFNNLVLDKYEQEIEDALAKGEYINDPDFSKNKKLFEEAAENHIQLRQSKSITLRVNQEDLIKVKAKAKRRNVPYQTLINILINQYAKGKVDLIL